jgi:hypothetical protein
VTEGAASWERRGWAEVKDAVTPRAALFVVGVLALQLGFITSFLGAFHHPTPHRVPLAVSGPPAEVQAAVRLLDRLPGHPLAASPVGSPGIGRRDLLDQRVDGVLELRSPTTVRLEVASAGGPSVAQALEQVLGDVAAGAHLHLVVQDLVPPVRGDYDGLSAFYLVIGWTVGGYLVASLLGVTAGSRPANLERALVRLGALGLYAVVSGFAGAAIAGPGLHSLPSDVAALGALGALLVFAAGAFTVGLQVLAGTIGIGLAIVLFVVLGDPAAGGAFGWSLLPAFWRDLGPWLPTGAATVATRTIVYFDGRGVLPRLLVLGGYALAGVVLTLAALLPRLDRDELAPDGTSGPASA